MKCEKRLAGDKVLAAIYTKKLYTAPRLGYNI